MYANVQDSRLLSHLGNKHAATWTCNHHKNQTSHSESSNQRKHLVNIHNTKKKKKKIKGGGGRGVAHNIIHTCAQTYTLCLATSEEERKRHHPKKCTINLKCNPPPPPPPPPTHTHGLKKKKEDKTESNTNHVTAVLTSNTISYASRLLCFSVSCRWNI